MPARWRKQKSETGLARVCQGPRGFELFEQGGSRPVIHVAPYTKGFDKYTILGWYWYGMGENTHATPCETAEEAKTQAMEFYRKRAT
jgi:hypothetical protein